MLYALGSLSNKLTGFLLLPVYTHFLSTSDYGLIEMLDVVVLLLAITLGLNALSNTMVRLYQDHSDETHRYRVVNTVLLFGAAISALLSMLGIIFHDAISNVLFNSPDYSLVLIISFITVFPLTLVEVLLTHIRLREKPVFYVVFNFIRLLVSASLNIYFIAFLEMGVMGFVYSQLISSALAAITLLVHYFFILSWQATLGYTQSIIRYGYPFIFSTLAFFSIHFSDRLILNEFSTLENVGLYSLAYKFAFLIAYVVGEPFNRSWQSTMYIEAKKTGWQKYFALVFTRFSFVLCLFASLLVLFFDNLFGWIIDEKFFQATAFLPVLVLAYMIREQGDFFAHVNCINKDSKFIGKVAVLCALVNIALSIALIPHHGVFGAVLATLLTWVLYAFIHFNKQKHLFAIPFDFNQWITAVLIVGFVIIIERGLILLSPWTNFSINVLVLGGLIIFFIKTQRIDITMLSQLKVSLFGVKSHERQ